MRYEEFRPAEPLAKLIKCIWLMESEPDNSSDVERILPDGCTEIVFNFADPFYQHNPDGTTERQPLTLVVGQMLQALLIAPSQRVQLLGVRFWPGGAYPFLTVPQHEIAGQVIALDAVWGAISREIQSRLADAATSADRVTEVENILLARLNHFRPHDEEVLKATALIVRTRGRISIGRLAERMGINSRTLDRRFNNKVGLSPKALCRVIRFQRIFSLIERDSGPKREGFSSGRGLLEEGAVGAPDWVRLALECGYYDQPHFIKEFKAFAGKEPTAYFAERNIMSDHFTGSA
ncbi:MAG: helix-turn-helix domain-containing protein [Blastocatellia bacterium]